MSESSGGLSIPRLGLRDLDEDGVIRRIKLLHQYDGKMYPALALAAVAKYYERDIHPLNSDLFPGIRLDSIEVGDLRVPTDMHGRLLVNYYKRPQDYFTTVSVAAGTWTQLNDVLDIQGVGDHSLAYATVEVLNQDGTIWAYASVVDERTGDATTIPLLTRLRAGQTA